MSYVNTAAKSGQGSLLTVCATSGGTFVNVGEPIGDMGLRIKAMFEDATNQQSLSRERISVFPDYPSFPLEVNEIPTDPGQVILQAAALAVPTPLTFFKWQKVKLGTQTTAGDLYAFAAFIEQTDQSEPVNKKATVKYSLTISGAITLTPGS